MQERASRLPFARAALPLGLTLGLHLLLVLAWLAHSPPRTPDDGKGAVSVLIPVLIPALIPAPTPAPAPAPATAPAAGAGGPMPSLRARSAATASPSAAAPASAEPVAAADADTGSADPLAGAPPAPPAPPSLSADSELLGRAKRAAGPIDHALRGGKSEIPEEPDTPWGRFQRALASAHVERSLSETRERYTSPDGVVIYRARQRGRETCRQTGSVNALPGAARNANYAGNIPCPKGIAWQRY